MRFVTLNLWGERGPFERRMKLVREGLAALAPDVVALQEVREIPGRVTNMATELASALELEVTFAPAMEWGGGVEGVALLSRRPLADVVVRELPHASPRLRRVVLAGLVTSDEGNARVATTHLDYPLANGLEREDQVFALDALLSSYPNETRVLLGDLNATPDTDEVRFLTGKTTVRGKRTHYQDAWELHHEGEAGHTWARENPFTMQMRWLQPGRRIDYVLVSTEEKDGRGRIEGCEIALHVADAQGVLPSDHFAVVADVHA